MNAITLWQPWAWAVAHAGKDVENRGWQPPLRAIGHPLAIHAGQNCDLLAVLHLHEMGLREAPATASGYPRGAVVAVAILGGAIGPYSGPSGYWHERGSWGWKLVKIRTLTIPVHCRGHQGIWTLPPDVEAAVRTQLEAVA